MSSRARSLTVVLALIGALTLTSAASAQTLFTGEDLGYYDSTGRRVGTLSGWFEVVFHTSSGHTLFVIVMESRLQGNASLHFAQRGCAGAPFLHRENGREPSSWVGGPRQTVYVQDGPFRGRRMQSMRTVDGACVDESVGGDYAPAVLAGIDLADYFSPPFAYRARAGDPVPRGAVADPRDRTNTIGLYDAVGKRIGTTVPGPLSPSVPLVTDGGATFLVDYVGPARQDGYFATVDCTGRRFRRDGSEPPSPLNFSPHMLVGPRSTVYLPVGTVEQRTMLSLMEPDGDCVVLDQSDPGGYFDYWTPYESTGIDLADYFTPPTELRAGTGVRSLRNPD